MWCLFKASLHRIDWLPTITRTTCRPTVGLTTCWTMYCITNLKTTTLLNAKILLWITLTIMLSTIPITIWTAVPPKMAIIADLICLRCHWIVSYSELSFHFIQYLTQFVSTFPPIFPIIWFSYQLIDVFLNKC